MTLLAEQGYDVLVTPVVELTDAEGNVLEDLTERVIHEVSHVAYTHDARNPHSASIALVGEPLVWSGAFIAISLRVDSRLDLSFRQQSLGRYVVSSAARNANRPDEWRVDLQDVTVILDQAAGRSWTVIAGETVQQSVARVAGAADSPVTISDQLHGEVVPSSRTWPITDSATWLDVLSHLAESTGGRPPYMSPQGTVLLTRYVRLDDLPDTLYIDEGPTTLLQPGAKVDTDLHAVPNEIVVIADVTNTRGTVTRTVERRRNYDYGPASYNARGWWQRSVFTVDAVSREDLIVAADRIWDDTQYHALVVSATLTPTHRLWAHNVVSFDVPSLGLAGRRAFVRAWKLPLSGADMSVSLGVL